MSSLAMLTSLHMTSVDLDEATLKKFFDKTIWEKINLPEDVNED